MAKSLLISILFFCVVGPSFGQITIETADRYTNQYKDRPPGKDIYLVISFTENLNQYFFDDEGNALLTVIPKNGERTETVVNKGDFYLNGKTKFQEYFYFIANNRKIGAVGDFDLYLSSIDGMNYAKQTFKKSDRKKLIKYYEPPAPNASTKKKLKYYRRTGDSMGQLTGANRRFVIQKRKNCKAKKRNMKKNGVNGVKGMTYGM